MKTIESYLEIYDIIQPVDGPRQEVKEMESSNVHGNVIVQPYSNTKIRLPILQPDDNTNVIL